MNILLYVYFNRNIFLVFRTLKILSCTNPFHYINIFFRNNIIRLTGQSLNLPMVMMRRKRKKRRRNKDLIFLFSSAYCLTSIFLVFLVLVVFSCHISEQN